MPCLLALYFSNCIERFASLIDRLAWSFQERLVLRRWTGTPKRAACFQKRRPARSGHIWFVHNSMLVLRELQEATHLVSTCYH